MVIRKKRKQKKALNVDDIEYIVYCRKSSEESSKGQEQSILDQLNACIDHAHRVWLKLAEKNEIFNNHFNDNSFAKRKNKQTNKYEKDILTKAENVFYVVEEKSAKELNNRTKRNTLIKLVKAWKIKGILSFSPDRQARNLPESWELVQLLDDWFLDVKYTNFTFENNPNWRMVLGITFVISYNYSDNLGVNIGRWNKWAMKRWTALWKFKHGYFINKEKYHEPDPDSFHLRKEAFKMKLYQGKTDHEIRQFLVSSWYKRKYKHKIEEFKEKNIYTIWLDEFYYGVFICGDSEINLRDANPYYKPMIEKSEHTQLLVRYQNKNPIILRKIKPNEEYYELRLFDNGFIITEDGRTLGFDFPNRYRHVERLAKVQKTDEKATLKDVVKISQIRYTSSKKDGNWKKTSVNADIIDDLVYSFLKKNMKFTENLYEEFTEYQKTGFELKVKKNKEDRLKIQLRRNNIVWQLDAFVLENMSVNKKKIEQEIYDKEVTKLQSIIDALDEEIQSLSETERSTRLEVEAFFKILKKAPALYKKWSNVRKRKICNLLLSNIILNKEKGHTVVVKPWLEALFSLNTVSSGDDGSRTRVWKA